MSDKLIKSGGAIVPANDFVERVEEELRKRGEEPAERRVKSKCDAAYRWPNAPDEISLCLLLAGHTGEHRISGVTWERCDSVSKEGTRCRFQRDHNGAHADGEQFAWAQTKPVVVDTIDPSWGLIGDMLRDNPVYQELLRRKVARSAPVTQRVFPTRARSWEIGLGPLDLDPGQTGTVAAAPQVLFRGERLIVMNASAFVIENIFVGQRPQLSGAPVSASLFDPNALGSGMQMDTCNPALPISIVARNVSSEKQQFMCSIIGKAVL